MPDTARVLLDDMFTLNPTGHYWYRNGFNPNAWLALVLAGIPGSVIRDAKRRLRQLENREVDAGPQGDLFAAAPEPVEAEPHPALDALRALEPDNLSPREALDKLYELKRLSE